MNYTEAFETMKQVAEWFPSKDVFLKYLITDGYEINKPVIARLDLGDLTHAWNLAHKTS